MAINALKQQRLAIANGPDGLVFPSDEGTPLDHHNILARVWTPMLVGAGIFRLTPQGSIPKAILSKSPSTTSMACVMQRPACSSNRSYRRSVSRPLWGIARSR
ncbi:hypothetical protein [Mesorhizobium sp. M0589]|uniref:hypothetical protein n=1 Tax=Mesorhizobium sp. M0589 TaxID=2956965 RepID=UPI003335E86A